MAENPSAAPSAPPSKPAAPAQPEHHVKETIESILVAFILAFIFRGFIVEAFVIPTGSMGPTLLGAHMRYHCEDCGWRWTVSFSSGQQGSEIEIPSTGRWFHKHPPHSYRGEDVPEAVFCPNCGWEVPKNNPRDPDNQTHAPPIHYGDRILVLKYLYLFEEPQRWDVVVFKSPEPTSRSRPDREAEYTENYIKRLIGRPGEAVLILDGDIYVGPPSALKWQQSDNVRVVDPAASDWSKFSVQRKPHYVQQALWRTIHDNDFVPHLPQSSFKQPWTPRQGAGWSLAQPPNKLSRQFSFDNLNGAGEIAFDRTANPALHHLTDFLAYDTVDYERYLRETERRQAQPPIPVHDLRLALTYTRSAGDGPLRLELERPNGEVVAVELAPGEARLIRRDASGAEKSRKTAAVAALGGSQPVRVEFANVDYRASLRIDGTEVLAEEYPPDVASLVESRSSPEAFPQIRIRAERQQSRVEHLSLARDVHYLDEGDRNIVFWGTKLRPIELGKDEFFVLGDNPPISGDARMWVRDVYLPGEDLYAQPGRVPRRFMIGKAFFVYWPAGYRPFPNGPGLIPNFGEMRFIH